MRKLFRLINSKIFLYSLMILLQVAAIAFVIIYFNGQLRYFTLIFRVIAVIVAIYIVNTPIIPEYKIAWVIPVLALPLFGIPLYFLLGRKHFTKVDVKEFERSKEEVLPLSNQNTDLLTRARSEDYFVSQIANYVYMGSRSAIHYGDLVQYYPVGEKLYVAMMEELKKAEKYVFLEYFIVRPGKMLDSMVALLEEKIKQGVEVYLLYDDFGCTFKLPRRYIKGMRKIGMHVKAFEPFKPFISSRVNNRNHEKLLIIDGKVGFTGGVNLSDEYVNVTHPFGHWKDTGVKVSGETVKDMILTFVQMWNLASKDEERIINVKDYIIPYVEKKSDIYTVFIPDSPHSTFDLSQNTYIKMIEQAHKYVYITTPYLILNQDLKNALTVAALSGVDVRIIIPGIPDKKIVYNLAKAYAQQLIDNKVKVYKYSKGFIHAKSFVVDDTYSIVGTANLDYRSLYLHYEDGLFVRDKQFACSVKDDYLNTLKDCEELTIRALKVNIFTRAWRAIIRVIAPLL